MTDRIRTSIRVTLVLLLFCSVSAFPQESMTSLFSKVDIGSKKYYHIKVDRNISYTARIVSVDNAQTLIMMTDGTTTALPTSAITAISAEAVTSRGSVGLGYGVHYGGLGINVDARVYKSIYLTGGVGSASFKHPLFDIGGKFYLRKGNYKWQPRLTANFVSYGTVYNDDDHPDTKILDYFYSPTVGVGQLWTFGISKSLGFDFDFHYVITQRNYHDTVERYFDEGLYFNNYRIMKYTFSFGVRYCF